MKINLAARSLDYAMLIITFHNILTEQKNIRWVWFKSFLSSSTRPLLNENVLSTFIIQARWRPAHSTARSFFSLQRPNGSIHRRYVDLNR